MENGKSKLNIPYYRVAKSVLMNRMGLSEQEATNKIESYAFGLIERQINAKPSIDHAIDSIAKRLSLSNRDKEDLESEVYYEEYGLILTDLDLILDGREIEPNAFIMDTIFAVHDGWVKDNAENL